MRTSRRKYAPAFNSLYFVLWCRNFLNSKYVSTSVENSSDANLQYWRGVLYIARTIFYMNYCINFFLYSITGAYFRRFKTVITMNGTKVIKIANIPSNTNATKPCSILPVQYGVPNLLLYTHLVPETKMEFLDINGVCQVQLYLSYVSRFLSAWIVVAFTVERYIGVCHPLQRRYICSSKSTRRIVAAIFLIAVFIVIYKPIP
jgi:hypothetical protein